jgi:hypothetical protein
MRLTQIVAPAGIASLLLSLAILAPGQQAELGHQAHFLQYITQPNQAGRLTQGTLFVDSTNTERQVRALEEGWQMTLDGGETWSEIPWSFSKEAAVRVAFHPSVNAHLFASSSDGDAAYFDGSSWMPITLPPDSVLQADQAPAVLIQATASVTRLLLGTPHGLQYVDLPNQEGAEVLELFAEVAWTSMELPQLPVTTLSISPSGDRIAAGFSSGLVVVLADDPESGLKVVAESVPAGYSVVSIAFHPENQDDLMVTFAATSDTPDADFRAVYHSPDSGQSWAPVQFTHQGVSGMIALRILTEEGVHSVFASNEAIAAFREADLLGQQFGSKQMQARLASVVCRFTVTPTVQNVDHNGKRVRYKVDANSSTCQWRITSISSRVYLKIVKGEGRGDGEIIIDVLENSSEKDREFRISAAGKRLLVRQTRRPQINQPQNPNPSEPGGSPGTSLPNCGLVSAQPLTVGSAGGNVAVNLRINQRCGGGVRMQSNTSFVEAPAGTVTQSSITIRVAPNTSTQERRATVTVVGANNAAVDGGQINILQRAATTSITPCQPTLRSSRTSFAAAGGSADLTVSTTGTCSGTLTVEPSATFVTPRYPSGALGSQLGFAVAANPNTTSRSARIVVRIGTATSNEILITQDGQGPTALPTCILQFHHEIVVPASQREVLLPVTSNRADCNWTVGAFSTLTPEKTWAVPSSGSYTGSRQVRIALSGSPSQTRMGFFQVAGQTVTLIQRGTLPEYAGCSSISGGSVSIGLSGNNPTSSAGGEQRLSINAVSGCAYTITLSGSTSMVELLDPVRGVSNGVLRFRVLPNRTGMQRSVTFTINHVGAAPAPSITLRQFN